MPTVQEQLQNCVDWNIKMRDNAKQRAMALHVDMPVSAREAERDARHYQQNIDALNRRMKEVSL